MKKICNLLLPGIFAIVILMASADCYAQQQVQFTQYMFNNLIINPAYAGADEGLSATFINRSQWSAIKNAPRTQTLALHTLSDNKRMGIGLTLQNERIGVQKNMTGLLVYAYHLRISKHTVFSMGLQGGFHNSKRDYSSLTGSATDPLANNLYINNTAFDVGYGLYLRAKDFRVGLSAPSLIPDRIQLNDSVRVPLWGRNFFGFVSYVMKINDEVDLMPSMLIKYSPSLAIGFDANINFIYRKILTLGLSYRHQESVDFLCKARITKLFQLGYAYDHPFGEANRISNGSNEIMVNYLFKPERKRHYNRKR